MSEIKDAEINVARLMAEIREEAARRKAAGDVLSQDTSGLPSTPASTSGSQIKFAPELPRLNLRAETYQLGGDRYTLDELLKYYDAEFIENAYRAILKREPEGSGYKLYLEHLRSGRFDRLDILASLRYSAEGKERNVKIEGLGGRAGVRRLYRLPIIGYFVELLAEIARLPLLIRQQRQFEGYMQAQQERIQAQHERIVAHVNQVSEHIDEVHASIFDYFRKLYEDINRLADIDEQRARDLSEQFEARAEGLDEQLRTKTQALSEQMTEQMTAQAIHFSQHAEQVAQQLQATRADLVLQERRTLKLLEEARKVLADSSGQQPLQVIAEEERYLSDAFYATFEEHFRGSREEIMNRLQFYLPILRRAGITKGILDIGTGRGEWLEVLQQEGILAQGVDTNRVQVEACTARGLEVTHDDAVAYLRGLPDNHLSAVTGFHIIEHLEFETLVSLLDEVMRTLAPGGLVIFETPNPENVSVTGHNFYVDPTHRNPLPIPMMKFLLESRGFYRIEIIRLHPSETPGVEGDTDLIARFNDYFYGPMDYAILGSKA